jgi:TusA-related sulfurtransferase
MKPLKKIKPNTMKKKIVVLAMAIMLLPAVSMAQDVFDKYSDNSDVTYVSIKPKMFQMIAKMGINVDEPEAKAYMDMVKSITSFKTIVTDNKAISADITKWVKSRAGSLEELMQVKDEGTEVKFYVKEGKDPDHVKELLIFVNGIDKAMKGQGVEINGEQRKIETVVVSLTGDINLNEISKLTEKMNIPGGDHLDKKERKI